jgi:tetratricopeptide (TPR) repeat protein
VTAERKVREQRAIAARLLEADPQNPLRLREDLEARGTLEEVLRASGRSHELVSTLGQTVEEAERLVQADPGSRRSSVMLMSRLHSASDGLGAGVDPGRALEYSDRALRLAQKLNRSDPDDRDVAAWVVRILAGRALLLARLSRFDEQVQATEEAVRTMEWLEPRWEGGLEKATLWVTVLQARAVALQQAGRGVEIAGPARRLSAVLRARALQGPEGDRQEFLLLLTDVLQLIPEPTGEERLEARSILDRVSSGDDPSRLLNAASRLRRAGEEDRARAVARRVLEIARPDQGLFVKQARDVLGGEAPGPSGP